MPLEQVEWFMKQSKHDNGKVQARQCCTYYSVLNVNKPNYPFLSSYEQEQTWTLTRTISNSHKRYQSSIDNIYLTTPNLSLKTKYIDYDKMKIENDRSLSLYTSLRHRTPSSSRRSINIKTDSHTHPEQKSSPIKIRNNNHNSNLNKPQLLPRLMRVIHANGELLVRI
ncbi:unnamed protein product [Adineta steineri]|uniref:Uncharacterized protein n=1 Tax=Adineta steineri TaxID=433720 RepID=A0A813URR8_9BILA|nr:unnamed protein product [Adineta steineri]CAF0875283.1 unnamed protein product [Adineta steineri]CAF3767448.1 unnamed protein product [Adineta steineri]